MPRLSIWGVFLRRADEAVESFRRATTPGDLTMRFLSMIRIDETTAQVPSEQLMADMGQLIEELTRSGQLVSTAGLRPTSEGVRVRLQRGGKLSVVDGPFAESKEVIGGYAILEAQSKAEAVELTQRFLRVHGSDWDVECEVRQLDGPEFGCKP
jgi:hypothetical protein